MSRLLGNGRHRDGEELLRTALLVLMINGLACTMHPIRTDISGMRLAATVSEVHGVCVGLKYHLLNSAWRTTWTDVPRTCPSSPAQLAASPTLLQEYTGPMYNRGHELQLHVLCAELLQTATLSFIGWRIPAMSLP